MTENEHHETVVKPAVDNAPGCFLISLQSFGLCLVFSIIALLARTLMVKGTPADLMANTMTILIMCPILEFWFPVALYSWLGGRHKALVVGAALVAVINAVVMASWLDHAIASAG